MMRGDNLLGEQPLKFYSKEMTETKIKLVDHYFKFIFQSNSITDLVGNRKNPDIIWLVKD